MNVIVIALNPYKNKGGRELGRMPERLESILSTHSHFPKHYKQAKYESVRFATAFITFHYCRNSKTLSIFSTKNLGL